MNSNLLVGNLQKERIEYEFPGKSGYLLVDRHPTDSNFSLSLRAMAEIERLYPESRGQKKITKIIGTNGTIHPPTP